jgi:hypothetical protein
MSTTPLFTYRLLGAGTGVLNITSTAVTGAPALQQITLQLGTPLVANTNVFIDSGANQEQVIVVSYNPLIPAFTANFNLDHASGVPIIVPSSYDPQWGQGQSNFIANLPAVQQAIQTRLLLFQGEWWASTTDGLPLWQAIAAQSGAGVNQMAAIISARIQATPYVISLNSVTAVFNVSTRAFTYSAQVNTQFGMVPVTVTPTPPSGALPNG